MAESNSTSIWFEVCRALHILAFEHVEGTWVRPLSELPDWWQDAVDHPPSDPRRLQPAEAFPYLETFMDQASEMWKSGSDRPITSGIWHSHGSGDVVYHFEATALNCNGQRLLTLQRMDSAGHEKAMLLQDVRSGKLDRRRDKARRDRIEAALREEKQVAERVSELKSKFLANVSHELRTPLTTIIGMTELALQTADSSPTRDGQFVATIRDSAQILLRLINDLLDFSRIESGRIEFQASPFSLTEVIASIVHEVEPAATAKSLSLTYEVAAAVSPIYVGDAGRVRQVLVNLLTNAIKFTNVGSVKLSANTAADSGLLLLCVADTGIGIPESKRELIFEAFSQADASITRDYGGTGLGLSICRTLVRAMGGDISVASEEGQGSQFTIALPLSSAPTQTPETATSPSQPDGAEQAPPLRILVAEDHIINAKLIAHILESRGHHVTHVENGQLAWEACQHSTFDIVLMDCQLPVMDGFQATREIRKWERAQPNERTPVTIVALTARAIQGDEAVCREAGMDGYLSKPFEPRKLWETVETMAKR